MQTTTAINFDAAINALCAKAETFLTSINQDDARRYVNQGASVVPNTNEMRNSLNEILEPYAEDPQTVEQTFNQTIGYLNDILALDYVGVLETAKTSEPITEAQYYTQMGMRLIDCGHDVAMVGVFVESMKSLKHMQPMVFTSAVARMQADLCDLTFKFADRCDQTVH